MSPQQTNANDDAGLGIGVVQPQSGLDYPFVSPGLNANPTYLLDVRELFADFYLSYDDRGYYWDENQTEHPLRIYWLYGFGAGAAFSTGQQPIADVTIPQNTHAKDLLVLDVNNNVVFDSTQADEYEEFVWGTHYKIIEWRRTIKPTDFQQQQRIICRAVQFLHLHTNTDIPERPISFCPRNAILDERTIEKIPKRVLSFRVKTGNCVSPWFHEKVTFVNGYNTELTIGEAATFLPTAPTLTTSLRKNTDVGFSVSAGSGKGQFGVCSVPLCEEDHPTNVCPVGQDVIVEICDELPGEKITTINGVSPNKGNLNLNSNDCLFVRKPVTYSDDDTPHNFYNVNGNPKRSVMAIGGDCNPCCACDDYVEVAKYLAKIANKYKVVGDRVATIQNSHKQNIQRWNGQRDCRLSKPLRLMLVQQPCPCIDVVAMYCNQCDTCAENVKLTITLASDPAGGTATIDPNFTQIVGVDYSVPAVINGGWPVFSVDFPSVKTGASVYVKFRLCFCPSYPYAIQGTLTGVKNTGPILAGCTGTEDPAAATANQILDCEV